MATISKLVVSLEANSAKLYDTLSKSRKRFKKWAKNVGGYIKSIGKAFLIPIAAVGGFIVALNKSAAAIDNITKAAGKLGFPIEDYQRFAHIASISNVSMEQFGKGMQRMLKTVGDARDGLSTATKAFDALGLSWDVLAQQTPTEQLNQIGEALNKLPTQADKVKVAMDIFGRSGADFLNVFKGDVAAVGKEFDSLGITITAQQAAAVAAFQDSKTVLGALVGGIADNVTATLAPALTILVDKTKDWIKSFGGGKKVAAVVAKVVIKTISAMIKGFAKLARYINEFEGELIDMQAAWLAFNYPIDLQFDTTDASKQMDELTKRRGEISIQLANKSEFVANVEKLAKDIEATVNVSLDEGEDRDSVQKESLAEKADKNAADAANRLASTLDAVSGSSAWKDIFAKEKINERSYGFDNLARQIKDGIASSSSFTGSKLKQLSDIVLAAKNNQRVFSQAGNFEKVDIQGMDEVASALQKMYDVANKARETEQALMSEARAQRQELIDSVNARQSVEESERRSRGVISAGIASDPEVLKAAADAAAKATTASSAIAESLVKISDTYLNFPKLGELTISLQTDGAVLSGKLFGTPAFIEELKSFNDRQQQDGTRADTA